jgi:hypothetical protein
MLASSLLRKTFLSAGASSKVCAARATGKTHLRWMAPDTGRTPSCAGKDALPEDVKQSVTLVHASPVRAVVYVTGGAAQAVSWLLCVAGASCTVLDAAVPYSHAALRQLLSHPARHCPSAQAPALALSFASASTAAALAAAAYRRAVLLADPGERVVGVAAACALVTVEQKQGSHRAYIAAHADESLLEYELVLKKGARDRVAEDNMAARLVVQALADASCWPVALSCENTMALLRDRLVDGDTLSPPRIRDHGDPIEAILAADADDRVGDQRNDKPPVNLVQFDAGRWRIGAVSTSALLPGSFNPLHRGHRALLEAARAMLGPNACIGYELAVTNVEKPSLDAKTIRQRAQQFSTQKTPLVISRAPKFVDKATILPNHVFIVGHDTATRLVDPRYYGGQAPMLNALMSISQKGCSFLVAGRRAEPRSGPFLTLDDVDVPAGFESLFVQIPERLFREDVSSTMIRQGMTE